MSDFSIGSGYSSKEVLSFLDSQHNEPFDDATEFTKPTSSQIEAEDGTIYVLDDVGDVKESSKPTVKGQFKKPGLWRYGKPQAEILHLDKADDLAQYNKILAGLLVKILITIF